MILSFRMASISHAIAMCVATHTPRAYSSKRLCWLHCVPLVNRRNVFASAYSSNNCYRNGLSGSPSRQRSRDQAARPQNYRTAIIYYTLEKQSDRNEIKNAIFGVVILLSKRIFYIFSAAHTIAGLTHAAFCRISWISFSVSFFLRAIRWCVCACSISPQHSCVFHFVTFTKLMITTTYHNRPLKNLHGNRFSCFPLPVYETYLSFIHIQNLRSVHAECLPIHSLTVICISFNIVIIFIFPKIIKVGVKYMQTTVAVVVVAMYALTVFCAYEIAPSSSECVAKYKHRNLLFLFVSNLITIFSPASSFVS